MSNYIVVQKDDYWVVKPKPAPLQPRRSLKDWIAGTPVPSIDRQFPEIPDDAIVFFEYSYDRLVPATYCRVTNQWSSRAAYNSKYEVTRLLKLFLSNDLEKFTS